MEYKYPAYDAQPLILTNVRYGNERPEFGSLVAEFSADGEPLEQEQSNDYTECMIKAHVMS